MMERGSFWGCKRQVSFAWPSFFQTQSARGRFRFKSLRSIISEAGGDIEDTFEEIAADNQLAESKGVELNADRASQPGAE